MYDSLSLSLFVYVRSTVKRTGPSHAKRPVGLFMEDCLGLQSYAGFDRLARRLNGLAHLCPFLNGSKMACLKLSIYGRLRDGPRALAHCNTTICAHMYRCVFCILACMYAYIYVMCLIQ